MTDKWDIAPQDQIILTRVAGSGAPKFQVHRTGPGRGIAATDHFIGTFDEAVDHIRSHYTVQ
jgi:hypothetical protein